MSIQEAVIQKLNTLSPEKQEEVLHLVKSLAHNEADSKIGKPYSWMEIALKADLKGPSDWSEHLDDYLYGDKKHGV